MTKCEVFYFQNYLPELYKKIKKEKGLKSQVHMKKSDAETRCFTGINIVNTDKT